MGCPSRSPEASRKEGVWESLGERQGIAPGEALGPSRFVSPRLKSSALQHRGGVAGKPSAL